MRKKLIVLMCVMSFSLFGCSHLSSNTTEDKQADVTQDETTGEENEEAQLEEPDLAQIRSICKLATLECYYHNVAKSVKEAGTGITHWGEKNRKFWTEYNGVIKIGVDMSKGTIDVDGTDVTVYMPEAEILGMKLEDASIGSAIMDADGLNSNEISADDVTGAVDDAQDQIREKIENDSSLIVSAQDRAEKLILNYINKLGEISGVEFKVHFETISNKSSSDSTESKDGQKVEDE